MNDLITSAKAVIECWDDPKEPAVMHVDNLRAAVERAEKQETVGFDEWFPTSGWNPECVEYILEVWQAAQQAERERIKKMIGDMIDQDDPWIHYSTLLEKIDDSTL